MQRLKNAAGASSSWSSTKVYTKGSFAAGYLPGVLRAPRERRRARMQKREFVVYVDFGGMRRRNSSNQLTTMSKCTLPCFSCEWSAETGAAMYFPSGMMSNGDATTPKGPDESEMYEAIRCSIHGVGFPAVNVAPSTL
jgi:hypothetical protein